MDVFIRTGKDAFLTENRVTEMIDKSLQHMRNEFKRYVTEEVLVKFDPIDEKIQEVEDEIKVA